jgi:hypothetical protein
MTRNTLRSHGSPARHEVPLLLGTMLALLASLGLWAGLSAIMWLLWR